MLYPVSNKVQIITSPASRTFKIGDVVSARIVDVLSPYQKLIRLKGKPVIVNSNLPLKKGDFLLLQLTEIQPRLRFKLIQNFSASSLPQILNQLAIYLGLEARAFNLNFIKLALLSQNNINIRHLKLLKQLTSTAENADTNSLLFAYFFQQQTEGSSHLPPDFFPRWIIGQFQFLKMLRKFQSALGRKDTGALNVFASDEITEKFLFLGEFIRKTEIFYEARLSGLPRTFQKNSDFLHSLKAQLLQYRSLAGAKDLLAAIHFIQLQFHRWQNGRWAALPFSQKDKDSFFFIKKNRLNSGDSEINFRFDVETKNFDRVAVEGRIKGNKIFLEFRNSIQEFFEQTDDNSFALRSIVRNLGFETIEIHHRKTYKFNWALKEIFTKESLTRNWMI